MQKFIIRFGGLIPTYHACEVLTCHPSEATQFDSIEYLKLVFYNFYGTKQASILDASTGKFIQWLNY